MGGDFVRKTYLEDAKFQDPSYTNVTPIGATKPRIEAYQRGWNDAIDAIIAEAPAVDVVEVVRCRDCKHRIVNEHFGKRGYIQLKAMCELDTGDPFELGRNAEEDDWFCADGERKDGGQDA